MKAIRIHAYGPADALRYEEAPEPVAGPGEVVVAVEAAGVNPADYKFRSGLLAKFVPKAMPLTLGMDIAGHVASVGTGVSGLKVGDRVLAMLHMMGNGGYAERVAVPAEWCAPLPAGLDAATAAALPTPGTTAVEMIEDELRVAPGQQVLVIGATGAVGRIACHVAKRAGAHVTGAVRPDHAGGLRDVDDVLILGGEGAPVGRFDAAADTVGGEVARKLLPALKAGGLLVSVATDRFQNDRPDVEIRNFGNYPDALRLGRLAAAAAEGDLELAPVETMRFSEAAVAHRRIEAGRSGKIVLIPD